MDLTIFYELLHTIEQYPEAKTVIMPLDLWFKFKDTEIFMNYGRFVSAKDGHVRCCEYSSHKDKIELFDLELIKVSPHLMKSDYVLTDKVITKTGTDKIMELEKIIAAAEGGK